MTVIYIDVLILFNLYVNYLLLRAASVFTHIKLTVLRTIFAALAGSLFSLTILLPEQNAAVSVIIKLITAATIVFLSFGYINIKSFVRNSVIFFFVNFIFVGAIHSVWSLVGSSLPVNMYHNNGSYYIDISLFTIIAATILSYMVIKFIRYIVDVKIEYDKKYRVIIHNKNKRIELSAFADSGNTLTDSFSGMPVIICEKDSISDIIPDNLNNLLQYDFSDLSFMNNENINLKGIKLLPFKTVNSGGIIPAFKPDRVTIFDESQKKNVNVLIGVGNGRFVGDTNGESTVIFNPKILI